MAKKIESMNLEELEAEATRLAALRSELRVQQRAVEERKQVELALAGLSPTVRASLESSVGTSSVGTNGKTN